MAQAHDAVKLTISFASSQTARTKLSALKDATPPRSVVKKVKEVERDRKNKKENEAKRQERKEKKERMKAAKSAKQKEKKASALNSYDF